MRKIRIEPYKTWSGGARALGQRCGILRATKRQVAKHGDFDVIINWGRTERRFNGQYFNNPAHVAVACDKRASLETMAAAGVPVPDFTSKQSVAQEWLDSGETVVVRTLLRANSGRGISLVTPQEGATVPRAPLYTKYAKKAEEYRIHVVKDQVVDAQLKKRKLEVPDEEVDFQIRNSNNGWIFARENVVAPDCVVKAAIRAVGSLNLDFGAVDIGYNIRYDQATVYEVNTAPGIEGTTLERYYESLCTYYPAIRGGWYAKRRRANGF